MSLYTRVALIVPMTFCLQTDKIKAKRLCYTRVLLVFDLLAYSLLTFIVTYELFFDKDFWFVNLNWQILSIILTVALCLAFHRIRQYSEGLAETGVQANRSLLLAHQSAFIAATVIGIIPFSLDTVYHFDADD